MARDPSTDLNLKLQELLKPPSDVPENLQDIFPQKKPPTNPAKQIRLDNLFEDSPEQEMALREVLRYTYQLDDVKSESLSTDAHLAAVSRFGRYLLSRTPTTLMGVNTLYLLFAKLPEPCLWFLLLLNEEADEVLPAFFQRCWCCAQRDVVAGDLGMLYGG